MQHVIYGDVGRQRLLPSGGRRGNVMHSNHIRLQQQQMDLPTEAVYTALSNQILSGVDQFVKESVAPCVKELSALYEGNSTQAEIDACKTFLAAQREKQKTLLAAGVEECKIFLNSKIVAKKAELVKPNAGRPKGKRVSSSVVSNKRHKTHGTPHMR